MSAPLNQLRSQIAQTRAQREAVRLRAAQTVDRLAPQRLMHDALNSAEDAARETAAQIKAHPFTAVGALVGTMALLFRKPLLQTLTALLDEWLPLGDNPAQPDADAEPDDVSES